jgi:1-acyl-sn-glycerol-3-phosphate acyltransferase
MNTKRLHYPLGFVGEIFGRIWALWALVLFFSSMLVITLIPCIISYLLPEPKGSRLFLYAAKIWMDVFLNLIGCPLKVKGKENLQAGQNYVVVCNHNSLMDIPLTSPYIPGGNKTIAKDTFIYIPIFNIIYARGSVLVNRKDTNSRKKSFDKMKAVLATGLNMVIYPEGTRNRTDQPLKTFYDGAFKLAVDTKKPVLPTVIFNTARALPVHKTFFCWPTRLEMHFLPPIAVTSSNTADQIKQQAFDQMTAYCTQNMQ